MRVFSSRLTRRERAIYGSVTAYFGIVFLAMIWPVSALFSRVRPLVLGMPFSLFYLALLLTISFGVMVALFVWEGRRERSSSGEDQEP